jgi:ribosomal protein S24E
MKVLSNKKSDLLPRTEIKIEIEHTSKPTPTLEQIKEEIVKEFKCDKEVIKIQKVNSYYGLAKIDVEFFIYNNKADITKLEKLAKKQKEKLAKEVKEEVPKEVKEEKNDKETKTKE